MLQQSDIPLLGYEIPSIVPTFTTPTLDFNNHYKELEGLVENLYRIKNTWFRKDSQFPLDTTVRNTILKTMQEKTLQRFNLLTFVRKSRKNLNLQESNPLVDGKFDPTLSAKQKGMYHYLRGKLHDFSDFEYSQKAEDDLTKALKLYPGLSKGWVALGECFWKKGDFKGANFCFHTGLLKVLLWKFTCLMISKIMGKAI